MDVCIHVRAPGVHTRERVNSLRGRASREVPIYITLFVGQMRVTNFFFPAIYAGVCGVYNTRKWGRESVI